MIQAFQNIISALAAIALSLSVQAGNLTQSINPAGQLAQVVSAGSGSFTPEPPREYVDTTMPAQTGQVRNVNSANNCNNATDGLQAQINAANLGDTIVIPAGMTCLGQYRLRNKTSGSGWIVIKSSRADEFPEGVRVKPSDRDKMAKIFITSGSTFSTDDGAHHYRLIGLELAPEPTGTGTIYNIVTLSAATSPATVAKTPHHIVLDRVYIHGYSYRGVVRGVAVNSIHTAVINSYISEIHFVGQDAQAIQGNNGPGPFKIVNNYLEGSGENIMFGGAPTSAIELMPADIEIRGNYFYKPWTWKYGKGATLPATCKSDPTYSEWGERFEVINADNTHEFYQCRNNSWTKGMPIIAVYSAGTSLPATCRVDESYNGWGEYFKLLDAAGGTIDWYQCKNGSWFDWNMAYGRPPNEWLIKNLFELKNAQRVLVEGNVLKNSWIHGQRGGAVLYNGVDGRISTIENVWFKNNYITDVNMGIAASAMWPTPQMRNTNSLKFSNNFFNIYKASTYMLDGIFTYFGPTVDRVEYDHNTAITSPSGYVLYIGDGTTPTVDTFTFTNNIITSPSFTGQGFGGANNLISRMTTDATFTKNVFVGGVASLFSNYPGNYLPANISSINFANAAALDYRLTATSPYKGQGTNGKDIGVDWDRLNSAIVGSVSGTWSGGLTPLPDVSTPPPPPPAPTPISEDLNSDNIVNSIDFSILNSRWNQNYSAYDLNRDNVINALDYNILHSRWFRVW